MITVRLDATELHLAAYAGIVRQERAVAAGLTPGRRLADEDSASWDLHIRGALAELAVAKYLNRYWNAFQSLGAVDVGESVEVKYSGYDDAHLIVGTDARDEFPYVLVTGVAPSLDLRGWTLGCVAKDARFWRENGRPAFWIPQKCLRPIEHLPLYLDGQPIGGGR